MRRILFLDDNESRLNQADNFFGGEELYLPRTAESAIFFLSKGLSWDLVMLDHDLGGEIFVGSDREDCGMEVVRYIERALPEIEEIIIHSWNAPAANEMRSRLTKQGYNVDYRPFQGLQGVWDE